MATLPPSAICGEMPQRARQQNQSPPFGGVMCSPPASSALGYSHLSFFPPPSQLPLLAPPPPPSSRDNAPTPPSTRSQDRKASSVRCPPAPSPPLTLPRDAEPRSLSPEEGTRGDRGRSKALAVACSKAPPRSGPWSPRARCATVRIKDGPPSWSTLCPTQRWRISPGRGRHKLPQAPC